MAYEAAVRAAERAFYCALGDNNDSTVPDLDAAERAFYRSRLGAEYSAIDLLVHAVELDAWPAAHLPARLGDPQHASLRRMPPVAVLGRLNRLRDASRKPIHVADLTGDSDGGEVGDGAGETSAPTEPQTPPPSLANSATPPAAPAARPRVAPNRSASGPPVKGCRLKKARARQ